MNQQVFNAYNEHGWFLTNSISELNQNGSEIQYINYKENEGRIFIADAYRNTCIHLIIGSHVLVLSSKESHINIQEQEPT